MGYICRVTSLAMHVHVSLPNTLPKIGVEKSAAQNYFAVKREEEDKVEFLQLNSERLSQGHVLQREEESTTYWPS